MPVSKNRRKNMKKSVRPTTKRTLPKQTEPVVALDDFRSMEQVMAGLQQGFTAPDFFDDGPYERDPLSQAQELVYDAWECGTKRDRIKLAKQALEISDQCADAYVMLAQEVTKNVIEARAYYEQAVSAGERAIGPEYFERNVGHFWGVLETRPYMRARAGLAECLWEMGERTEAVEHLKDMMRLNPNDNQGLRGPLVSRLLELDDLGGAKELLKQYKEPSFAAWSFSKALLLFKQHNATSDTGSTNAKAARRLKSAHTRNPHVAPMLLEEKRIPKRLPDSYSLGSVEEATFYVRDNIQNWKSTKGALQWLHETTKNTRPKAR